MVGRGCESALYEVVCPAIYVIRVFGLAPYAYPKDNRPPRLRASNFNCLFTVAWIGIYTYIVTVSMIRFEGLDRNKPVLGVTENGKLVLNYLVLLADLVLGVRQRAEFVRVWNSIQDFDESFELAGSSLLLRRARFYLWSAMLFSLIAWLLINQLGMRAFNEPYLQNVSYMITYVGSFVAVFKFCGLVLLLGQRFSYLSDLLATRLLRQLAEAEASAFIKKIESSYNKLLSTSEELNDIYSWSILLFLLNLCCHTVSNMYFFIVWTIVDPKYLSNPKVVFCEFSWLLIYIVQLLLLHIACHFASLEEFSSTLNLLNRKLNFTAAGCFNVNLPLLTSTVGYLSTYLVILLQLPDATSS